MGKVYSLLIRSIRTFNIENRAHRIISKEKPIPAPQYSSVQKQKEIIDRINPDLMTEQYKKDPRLQEYLKNVFVTSIDPKGHQQKQQIISTRQLPTNQSQHLSDNDTSNFDKPYQHMKDKCTFPEALEFINMYQENPTENTIDAISQRFQLDKQVIQNIVTNFKIFYCVDMPKKLNGDKKKE